MDDLISRQVAIEAMKNMYEAAEKWGRETTDDVIKTRAESCMASLIEMKLRIEKLPSAQPEIIRCEDCRWGKEVCGNIECFVDDDILTEYHGYKWFCPKGER